jgi:hypothetical protein
MSRVGNDSDEEGWPNQGEFWWANAQRALKGKRGRKALAELREALLMLPEKRLVAGAISTATLKAEADAEPDTLTDWQGKTGPNIYKAQALTKCATEGIGVCAVGAYLLRKRVLATGEPVEVAMAALPSGTDIYDTALDDTVRIAKRAGITQHLGCLLVQRNCEQYRTCTPEERYDRFFAWIDTELAVTA